MGPPIDQGCHSPFCPSIMNLATGLLLGLLLISPICSFPLTFENLRIFNAWLRSYTSLPLDDASRQYLDERNNTAVFLCLQLLKELGNDPKDADGLPIYLPRMGPNCTEEELKLLWGKAPELLPNLLLEAAFIPTRQFFSPHQLAYQEAMIGAASLQLIKNKNTMKHVFSPDMPGYRILGISTSLLTMGKADGEGRYIFNCLPGHGLGIYADRRKIILSDQFGASWNDQLAEFLADPRNDNDVICSRQELQRIQPGASMLALWINEKHSIIEVRSIGRPVLRPCLVVATQAGMAKVWPLVGDDGQIWVPFLKGAYIVFLDDQTLSHMDCSKPIYDWKRIQNVGLDGLMYGAIKHMEFLNGAGSAHPRRPIFAVSLGSAEEAPSSATTQVAQMPHPGVSVLTKRPTIARPAPVCTLSFNPSNPPGAGNSAESRIVFRSQPPPKRQRR